MNGSFAFLFSFIMLIFCSLLFELKNNPVFPATVLLWRSKYSLFDYPYAKFIETRKRHEKGQTIESQKSKNELRFLALQTTL